MIAEEKVAAKRTAKLAKVKDVKASVKIDIPVVTKPAVAKPTVTKPASETITLHVESSNAPTSPEKN